MAMVPAATGPIDPTEAARLLRRASRASVAVAVTLIVLKAVAWQWTDAVGLLASLVDSSVDALASLVTAVAIHASLRPADREHRFGHGKLEAVAGLVQSLLVGASAVGLAWAAVQRWLAPKAVGAPLAGVVVLIAASAITWGLVAYQRHVIRRTGSTAIGADALHYAGDLAMNGAVLVALVGSATLGWLWLDPALGLAVAVWVGRGAWGIGDEAVQLLMDRELPDEDRARLLAVVRAHAQVRGVRDLRTRRGGPNLFVQMVLELDGTLTLQAAHAICDEVEDRVREAYPGAEVILHAEPARPG